MSRRKSKPPPNPASAHSDDPPPAPDWPSLQRIIAEQKEQERRYQAEREEMEAKDREQAQLRNAWDAVAQHIEPDGAARSLPDAVRAVALLHQRLGERDLLGKLDEPPPGVEGEELHGWQMAGAILRGAADDPGRVGRLLEEVRGLPFASAVRTWLCHGFRKVVEGNWREGRPLAVQMLGSWQEPNRSDTAADQTSHGPLEAEDREGDGPPAVGVPDRGTESTSQRGPHLTSTEYQVLQQLARVHPQLITITDLAADLSCRRSAAGEAVQRLESLALVTRPEGPRSGVGITPTGLASLRPEDLPPHLHPRGYTVAVPKPPLRC